MDIADYHNLSDTMYVDEFENIFRIWRDQLERESIDLSLEKLKILIEHSYYIDKLPSDELRNWLAEWVLKNWDDDNIFIFTSLMASTTFGLSKKLYVKLLDIYNGDNKWEFEEILEKSKGENINPFWSIGSTNEALGS